MFPRPPWGGGGGMWVWGNCHLLFRTIVAVLREGGGVPSWSRRLPWLQLNSLNLLQQLVATLDTTYITYGTVGITLDKYKTGIIHRITEYTEFCIPQHSRFYKAARLQNSYRNDASLIRACAHAAWTASQASWHSERPLVAIVRAADCAQIVVVVRNGLRYCLCFVLQIGWGWWCWMELFLAANYYHDKDSSCHHQRRTYTNQDWSLHSHTRWQWGRDDFQVFSSAWSCNRSPPSLVLCEKMQQKSNLAGNINIQKKLVYMSGCTLHPRAWVPMLPTLLPRRLVGGFQTSLVSTTDTNPLVCCCLLNSPLSMTQATLVFDTNMIGTMSSRLGRKQAHTAVCYELQVADLQSTPNAHVRTALKRIPMRSRLEKMAHILQLSYNAIRSHWLEGEPITREGSKQRLTVCWVVTWRRTQLARLDTSGIYQGQQHQIFLKNSATVYSWTTIS